MTSTAPRLRLAVALLVPGVLALAGPLPAASAQFQPFEAIGSFEITAAHANINAGTLEGVVNGVRPFVGTFSHKVTGPRLVGSVALEFEEGTLEMAYEVRLDKATRVFLGTWIVTGSTGDLEGASGFGPLAIPQGPAGPFWLGGVIDW
jgi:hypothetical protein